MWGGDVEEESDGSWIVKEETGVGRGVDVGEVGIRKRNWRGEEVEIRGEGKRGRNRSGLGCGRKLRGPGRAGAQKKKSSGT